MLEQSDAVKQAWQASERTLDIVINVDGTDYQSTSINSLSYDAGAFTGDSLGIGSNYENSISAEFASVIEAFTAGQVVKPKIGIEVNGAFEYTPLGVFIISEVNRDRNNNLTTIKALDQMVKLERAYTSTLTYPAAMLDVVAEIANQGGVTVNQTDLAHLPNLPKLNSAITGQTLRTAIGWIAQFYAGFAAFDRSGQLTIRTTATPDYVINPSEYMQGGLTKNEVTYTTGGIKVSVTTTSTTETGEQEDKATTLQAGETSGSQIELTNNVMTNDALSTIWASIKDVSFYPYSLNWFGNPALEAGDWVTLTDTQGNKFNVPVNQLTFTFNGGLESTISANQASQSSAVMPWIGPTQNAITQAITRKTATGNNVYDPSFIEEPKNAKIGDVWFKQNGNNVELWTYSRDSSGNASWQKQEVDGEVKAQVEKAIDEAENAAKLAIEAQTTADGKNSVYRGSDPNTVPTAGLKDGDLYFTDSTLYTWTGTSWEETISDTTGAEIKAKVDEAIAEAKSAAETADAKNKVYRVKDVSVISTANLKTGDICFTDDAVYTWTGSAWEKTVNDTTGAEIKAKVDQVAQENQKAVADLTSNVESKAKDLDTSIQSTKTDLTAATNAVASDLSTTKSDLANVSKDLSDTKSNLGTVSNDLSEAKNNLATVTDDLSKTKSNLADTGQKLETAVSDFQKKTDQLSGSIETANSKIEFNSNAISEVKDTADQISTTVADHSGNISQLQQTADGLSATVKGGRNQLNNTSDTLQTVTVNEWARYGMSNDEPIAKHQLDGQKVTLSAWIENPSKEAWVQMYTDKGRFRGNGIPAGEKGWSQVTDTMPSGFSEWNIVVGCGDDSGTVTFSYSSLQLELGPNRTAWSQSTADIAQLKITANSLSSDIANAKGDISQLQQTANGLVTRVGDAEGNISTLQQTAKGLESTVGQMPAQWQQAINDKANAQVLSSGVDMNTLTTAGAYLIEDSQVKNSPLTAWFMAFVEATADGLRVVQRVKKDDANVAYERSNTNNGQQWTAWERVATGTDISSIQQTINGITTRVGDAESNVSTLQQTSKDLTARVGNAEGNISQLQLTADSLTSTISNGGTNLISGTRDFSFTHTKWAGTDPSNQTDQYNNTEHVTERKIVMTPGGWQGIWWPGYNTVGKTYTLSFDARCDNGKASVGKAGLENNFLSDYPTLTTDWVRYHYTVKVTHAGDNWIIYFCTPEADNVYIRKLQIEYGSTPTPWNPSSGDVSSIAQTASQLTSDMKDTKGNVSDLQQTASGLTSRVGDAEGNISSLQQTATGLQSTVQSQSGQISQLQQDAKGLTATVLGGGNLLNDTSDALQNLSGTDWAVYVTSQDGPVAKHQIDGKTVTLSVWIEKPSKDAWVQMYTDKGRALGNIIPAGGSGWSQVTYTMPSGFTDWNIVVGCGDNSGAITLSYSSLQLEIGPNRTAWSQSTADISSLKITANSLNAYVKESNGSQTLASLLSMDPQNSTIAQVVNGKPIAAINLSSEGDVTIDGKKLHITASTTIDDAAIGSAKIASLSADKITTGTLDASVVTVKNINADNISTGTLAAEHLHVTKDTVIDNGTIGNAQISNLSADKITAGTLDASQIRVINLDANSITTGSLSAAVIRASGFENYNVSPSNTFDFDNTKSTYGNWFLIGETTADHVYNGPKDANNNKLTPFMYVTSRGNPDGNRFTITVWKDDDPTQYQRTWDGNHWSDWAILPNSQNIVSAINLSPDSVMIAGKKITLDGDVTINGTAFANKLKATGITVDQLVAGNIDASKINVINLNANDITAGTINGNNLSINLDNGQVAFTKGNLHSTDGGFNISIDTKSFYLDMGNDTKLWIDSNGFHLQESDTQHLWLNKGGLHNYTTSNSNGVLIQDSTLSVLNNNGEGLVAQNGLLQFSTLPTWLNFDANSTLTAQAYGIIGPDKNLFGSSNGLFVKGREGVVIGTNSYNGETFLGSLFNANSISGSGISLSDDMTKAALFFTKAPLILAGGPTWDDSNQMSVKPYISVGSDWYYSHSGASMSQGGNGTYTRGNNIIVSSRNTNIIGYDWINFKSFGRIALDADYVYSYPTYLKTTSAGANVYVAEDGALLRSTSAAKYKTDIQPANEFADYGDKLINLTPKVWLDKAEVKRYKDDPEKNKKPGYYYGLIADELDQAGLNKLVTYGADGQVEGIQYDRLAVALLPIVKKLKEEVQELKERISK